ncbi:MAG: hypothetical protein DMF67_15965 [Acidobacteria bacterium]|nr:MAG: hypothetical protein DMF67_15965 [Acidobacteriota bacterium]
METHQPDHARELRGLEDAKAEALAAFAAIADIIDRVDGREASSGVESLRKNAAGHLSAALAIVDRKAVTR